MSAKIYSPTTARRLESAFSGLTLAIALSGLPFVSGCLETRGTSKEQEEKQVLRSTVANLQQRTADVNARFQDIEDDLRKLNGRLEAMEARQSQSATKNEQGASAVQSRVNQNDVIYREEFTKLNKEIESLRGQLASMQEESSRAAQAQAAAADRAAKSEKNPYQVAEEKFDQKNWKEAILDYEKYRKQNPKGKQFAMATYKIGVSFEELGMADEAKSFYEEVLSKFPKTKEADKASTRLKKFKKK